MLDPIKLTFITPGLAEDGTMADTGIPAAIVTNYLIRHRVVCEKTDYYSFLLLNSIGTTKAKEGALISGLLKFKQLYDANAPLSVALPDLYAAFPETYKCVGLRDHSNAIHRHFREHKLLDKMQAAFQGIPDQVMIVSLWRSVTLRQRLLQLRFENSIQSYLICQEITAEKSLFSAHALALHAPQPYHSLQGSKTVHNRLLAAALLFAFF